jgi:hypothetical protein
MLEEKIVQFTNTAPGQPTWVNGLVDLEMVRESKYGQMELATREIGKTIGLTVMANLYTLTVMFTKVTGLMTKPTEKEHIYMSMVLGMRASGKMIYNTEEGEKVGLMALSMKVTTLPVKSMVREFTAGVMAHVILENGKRIK